MNEANGDNFTYIRNTDVSFICRQVVEKENGPLLLRDAMLIPRECIISGYRIYNDPQKFNTEANCIVLGGARTWFPTVIEILALGYVDTLVDGFHKSLKIYDVEVGASSITQKFICPEFTKFYNQFHDIAVRRHELALKQLNPKS